MEIRELQATDIPALARLATKTYTETFGHSFTPEALAVELKETRSEEYFKSVMQRDTILVSIQNKEITGYIQLCDVSLEVEGEQPAKDDQAVHAVYINSENQGQGIGRMLMDTVFAHPRFQKAENVFIDVWDENSRAVSFYINYGFKVVGKCAVIVGGKAVGYDLVLKRSVDKK